MRVAIILLILAWLASITAAVTDLIGITSCLSLFGRTGSVVTLFAVILEYCISTMGQKGTTFTGRNISLCDVGKAALLTKEQKQAQLFAHVSVIFGTLIWGFGDLITGFCNS